MMISERRLTFAVVAAIGASIGFNLSPIWVGNGLWLNVLFLVYAGFLVFLHFMDTRVLGYAMVLTACNPANYVANLSFSLALAIIILLVRIEALGWAARQLARRGWWVLFLLAFVFIALSIPRWIPNTRIWITEVKQAVSRIGYIVMFSLAVVMTIPSKKDALRSVSILAVMAVSILVLFYVWGVPGIPIGTGSGDWMTHATREVFMQIGQGYMNFNRTSVCIVLAALAVVNLALGIGRGRTSFALIFHGAAIASVALLMRLASTGSAFAMVCGMAVIAFGYLALRPTAGRVISTVLLFSVVGGALFWAVFRTENRLAERIALKVGEGRIDRWPLWVEGITYTLQTPIGTGWTDRTTAAHSDWLLYFVNYGWLSGLGYFLGSAWLFWQLARQVLGEARSRPETRTLVLVALASLTVYGVNSILDMLSANLTYYNIVWACILTPSAALAVEEDTVAHLVPDLAVGAVRMPIWSSGAETDAGA